VKDFSHTAFAELASMRYGSKRVPEANAVTVASPRSVAFGMAGLAKKPLSVCASNSSISRRNPGFDWPSRASRSERVFSRAAWYSSSTCRKRSGVMPQTPITSSCRARLAR